MLLIRNNDKMVINGSKEYWEVRVVDVLEKIFWFILLSPLAGVFLWCIMDPEGSLLFGDRWKYKGELEPTEEAINGAKKCGIIGLVFTIAFYIIFILLR